MSLHSFRRIFHLGLFVSLTMSGSTPLPPPNILWITAEDISPAFGAYGDSVARTPHIDRLAQDSQVFTNAFAPAPICAPARSSLITGIYATSLGTQHLRSDVPIPDFIKTLPELLRAAGYYTTNNVKTDYNFDATGRWDELSSDAEWANAPPGKPFFSVYNYGLTHEGNGNKDGFEHGDILPHRVDPADVRLPPYFPNTPAMRALYARYYDLITVFDQKVGQHLQALEDAGKLDNTIVFILSDHGFGLPRYKRWLYRSGLHVPLIVHVPEAYREAFPARPGQRDDLVCFPDLAPTVLHLAGVAPPTTMSGHSLLAEDFERPFVYGARSRADDVYNIGRAIVDKRYSYVRNFTPHRPYIERAVIFAPDSKGSFRELHRLRAIGQLNPEAEAFWRPRPAEELYDVTNDPFELKNLAHDPAYAATLERMRSQLHTTILNTRDIGLLPESEFMRRAARSEKTAYEYAQTEAYHLEQILAAAETVGRPEIATADLLSMLQDNDSGVRYWGLIALQQRPETIASNVPVLAALLDDPSPAVALAAAELLIDSDAAPGALKTISRYLKLKPEPTTVLNAAMVARRIDDLASPLLPVIRSQNEHYQGKVWGRYASWSYPMFIGMAFDQIRINCGESLNLERN
jgi:N-sulfoglucosamine sulfohydrolase